MYSSSFPHLFTQVALVRVLVVCITHKLAEVIETLTNVHTSVCLISPPGVGGGDSSLPPLGGACPQPQVLSVSGQLPRGRILETRSHL